VMIYC